MVQKTGWIFKTNQQIQNDMSSKTNHPWHCFMNIPFSLARRICTIAENENVKEKRFKELKRSLLEQKYPKSLIKASILRAKEIPVEILRQPKTAINEEIIPFTFTHNPNNPNVFPIIKQIVKSMKQAPNPGRLLCRSKFESQHKNHEVKSCGKNCVSCPYLLNAPLYQFKQV